MQNLNIQNVNERPVLSAIFINNGDFLLIAEPQDSTMAQKQKEYCEENERTGKYESTETI